MRLTLGTNGKDVTINWRSLDIKNEGVFYTDANALKLVKRVKYPEAAYPIRNSMNEIK